MRKPLLFALLGVLGSVSGAQFNPSAFGGILNDIVGLLSGSTPPPATPPPPTLTEAQIQDILNTGKVSETQLNALARTLGVTGLEIQQLLTSGWSPAVVPPTEAALPKLAPLPEDKRAIAQDIAKARIRASDRLRLRYLRSIGETPLSQTAKPPPVAAPPAAPTLRTRPSDNSLFGPAPVRKEVEEIPVFEKEEKADVHFDISQYDLTDFQGQEGAKQAKKPLKMLPGLSKSVEKKSAEEMSDIEELVAWLEYQKASGKRALTQDEKLTLVQALGLPVIEEDDLFQIAEESIRPRSTTRATKRPTTKRRPKTTKPTTPLPTTARPLRRLVIQDEVEEDYSDVPMELPLFPTHRRARPSPPRPKVDLSALEKAKRLALRRTPEVRRVAPISEADRERLLRTFHQQSPTAFPPTERAAAGSHLALRPRAQPAPPSAPPQPRPVAQQRPAARPRVPPQPSPASPVSSFAAAPPPPPSLPRASAAQPPPSLPGGLTTVQKRPFPSRPSPIASRASQQASQEGARQRVRQPPQARPSGGGPRRRRPVGGPRTAEERKRIAALRRRAVMAKIRRGLEKGGIKGLSSLPEEARNRLVREYYLALKKNRRSRRPNPPSRPSSPSFSGPPPVQGAPVDVRRAPPAKQAPPPPSVSRPTGQRPSAMQRLNDPARVRQQRPRIAQVAAQHEAVPETVAKMGSEERAQAEPEDMRESAVEALPVMRPRPAEAVQRRSFASNRPEPPPFEPIPAQMDLSRHEAGDEWRRLDEFTDPQPGNPGQQ